MLTAVVLLGAAPAQGQALRQIRGHVVDAGTNRGVPAAWVELSGSGRRLGADGNGWFALEPADGEHRLMVRGLGYRTAVFSLVVRADTTLTLVLEVEPVARGAISVDVSQLADRLDRRTRALPWSVRVIGREELATSAAATPVDLLKQRRLQMIPCAGGRECVRYRGGLIEPRVCIDDRAADGGLAESRTYAGASLYRLEIHDGGSMIRAYTNWYFEQVRLGRVTPPALLRADRC